MTFDETAIEREGDGAGQVAKPGFLEVSAFFSHRPDEAGGRRGAGWKECVLKS